MISLGCCCIIAAAALSLYNRWTESKAGAEAETLTSSLLEMLETAAPSDEIETGVDAGLEAAQVSSDGGENGGQQVATVNVGGYSICGSLYIPALGLRLAVISEWSYSNLNISACRYTGSADDQLIIMAHNYRTHFASLSSLTAGDTAQFTDVNGVIYDYEVYAIETLATEQIDELLAGDDWDLTLFTCTYGGASRVVVRCALVEDTETEETR